MTRFLRRPHCHGDLIPDAYEPGWAICLLCARTFEAIGVVVARCGWRPWIGERA